MNEQRPLTASRGYALSVLNNLNQGLADFIPDTIANRLRGIEAGKGITDSFGSEGDNIIAAWEQILQTEQGFSDHVMQIDVENSEKAYEGVIGVINDLSQA